jgi:hypothetical protein
MGKLRAYRQYNETDVINHFKSDVVPLDNGTLVKVLSGIKANDDNWLMIGAPGAVYGNTVSQRYSVTPSVTYANTGSVVLGMTLHDVRETDENGENLKFNPRKAAEMQVVLTGQAVPIVTRGIFHISGVGGNPVAGAKAYLDDYLGNGKIATTGLTQVGQFLGVKDADGFVFFRLDV